MNIQKTYNLLLDLFGPQDWWPAETWFEVVIGAILTQQTRWESVERAISNMKSRGITTAEDVVGTPLEELEDVVRCTGFYKQKSRRLLATAKYFAENGYGALKRRSMGRLRRELLAINGIGPETADSILLYALDKPVFVIDAYTKRICECMGMERTDYNSLQKLFEGALPEDAELFKEYHALIVEYGKQYCNKKNCDGCVLKSC